MLYPGEYDLYSERFDDWVKGKRRLYIYLQEQFYLQDYLQNKYEKLVKIQEYLYGKEYEINKIKYVMDFADDILPILEKLEQEFIMNWVPGEE